MAIALLLCSFLFIHAQAAEWSPPWQKEPSLKDKSIEAWHKFVNWVEDYITKTALKIQNFWNSIFLENQIAVKNDFTNVRTEFLNSLSNYPKECTSEGKYIFDVEVKEAQDKSVSCITQAGKDVVMILFEAGQLTANILITADDIMNGLSPCLNWKFWNTVPCVISWIKTAIVDIVTTLREFKGFFPKVDLLMEDIRQQMMHCKEERHASLQTLLQDSQQRISKCVAK